MDFKKSIGRFLLVMMLTMQIALAQHATVHFMEGAHQNPAHSEQQDHKHKKDQTQHCQLCQFSKNFNKILNTDETGVTAPALTAVQIIAAPQSIAMGNEPSSYSARAPPAFSA